MAKKKKKQREPIFDDISPQTKQAAAAICLVLLGVLFILAALNYAGPFGGYVHSGLTFLLGSAFVLAPVTCFLYVYAFLNPRDDEKISIGKIIGIAMLFFAMLGLIEIYEPSAGGLLGLGVTWPLLQAIDAIGASVFLGAFGIIGVLLTFNTVPTLASFRRNKDEEFEDEEEVYEDETEDESVHELEEEAEETEEAEPEPAKPAKKKKSLTEKIGIGASKAPTEFLVSHFQGTYAPPPLSLLEKDKGRAKVGDVKANANIIKRTLKNFNIEVEMDEVTIGPSVTRYALKPAEGVRISKIVGLQNNLELALAASPVRIEAPIPGKALVGIEVPNTQKSQVGLASLLASPEYTDSPKPLLVALGRDISGKANFTDVAKMPHGMIAGTTGSGKSVTIQAIVASLLFRNSPEQLRFIMVDPKRVELTFYNGIPHLLTPVIIDSKKAILALKWAIKEMERRYDILQESKVRDIGSYHENIYEPAKAELEENDEAAESENEEATTLPEPMPYIVIIIDELSDLMQAYPRELEGAIVRLAQMSRAVGIHLILSTQRPSVNVITGLIKANVPSRIALKVASQIDSRTILDQPGAEKLLGQGDLLFLSNDNSKPARLQSAFISEDEIKKIVDYLKKQDAAQLDAINLDEKENSGSPDAFFASSVDDEDEDDLYEDARIAVIEAGKASTSYLQRKLRVGYSRAARLMDILEERGVIGAAEGSKPREILDQGGDDDYEDEPDDAGETEDEDTDRT